MGTAPQSRREARELARRTTTGLFTTRIAAPVVSTALVTTGVAASLIGLPTGLGESHASMGPAIAASPSGYSESTPSWQLANTIELSSAREISVPSRALNRLPVSWGAAAAEGRRIMSSRAVAVDSSLAAGLTVTASGAVQVREIAAAHAFHEPILDATRTSGFGWRWGRMHNGLDYGADIGTPLYAVAQGTVATAGWNSGLGYHVKVTLLTGETVVYGHMSQIDVSVDDKVEAGTVIGEVGSTGRSTGAHLHLEVRTADGPIDPAGWLDARRG